MKQLICHPLKQWSQNNMVATSYDSSHNVHCKLIRIMANDGSTWPLTCGRWHGAQYCTKSLPHKHVNMSMTLWTRLNIFLNIFSTCKTYSSKKGQVKFGSIKNVSCGSFGVELMKWTSNNSLVRHCTLCWYFVFYFACMFYLKEPCILLLHPMIIVK